MTVGLKFFYAWIHSDTFDSIINIKTTKMKTQFKLMALLVVIGLNLAAQPPDQKQYQNQKQRQSQARERNQKAKQELNLSSEQEAEWDKIVDENREKMKSIKSDNSLSEEQKKEMTKSIFKDTHDQLGQILDADQKKKYEELLAQRRGSGPKGPGKSGMNQAQRIEWMQEELALTDEQVEKIKTINQAYGEKMKLLKDEASEEQAQRKSEFKDLRAEREVEVLAVFNSEQQAKYLKLKEERKNQRK